MLLSTKLTSPWKTKILAAKHTGRLQPHHHTSYGGLMLVLLLALIPLVAVQHEVAADSTSGGGSASVYAVVPWPIPTTAPVITNVPAGKVFTSNDSFVIAGICPGRTQVKIFKNNVLAATVACHGGTFSATLDLFLGSNSLAAQAFNNDDIPGPASAPVSVRLLPPAATVTATASTAAAVGSSSSSTATQFYLTSPDSYRAATVGRALTWPLDIAGGAAPYSLTIDWGDGHTDSRSQAAAGNFDVTHTYQRAPGNSGNFAVVITAKDRVGQTALLQLSTLMPGGSVTTTNSVTRSGLVQTTGRVIATMGVIVTIFYLAERFQLRHQGHQAFQS